MHRLIVTQLAHGFEHRVCKVRVCGMVQLKRWLIAHLLLFEIAYLFEELHICCQLYHSALYSCNLK